MESYIQVEISIENASLYLEACEMLRNKLVEWNEITINNGAYDAPYKYEAEKLRQFIDFFSRRISSEDYSINDRVSEETLRLEKAAFLFAAHQHEQQILEKSKNNGWPPAVAEAAKGKYKKFRELAGKIKYDLPISLADILSSLNVTDNVPDRGKEWEWDAFISHASEDKEKFAAPLADALMKRGLKIWYDELTLKVGDSLRRSIDNGLSKSRFGIVILSHSFIKKEWPRKELDGLFAKERDGVKVLLPIWHEVSSGDIERFSPMLADRLAVPSGKGLSYVVDQLMDAIQQP